MSQSPLQLILASQSPRRRELAVAAGWDVMVVVPPVEAEADALPQQSDEDIPTYVTRLARIKAAAVAECTSGRDRAILACDTVGEIDGQPLGKPQDIADARRMISAISGRPHRVFTGVSLWLPAAGGPLDWQHREACAASSVFLEPLSADAIEAYLATDGWKGKAGSCGFQDGLLPLRLTSGSADTVVGLPVALIESLFHQR